MYQKVENAQETIKDKNVFQIDNSTREVFEHQLTVTRLALKETKKIYGKKLQFLSEMEELS